MAQPDKGSAFAQQIKLIATLANCHAVLEAASLNEENCRIQHRHRTPQVPRSRPDAVRHDLPAAKAFPPNVPPTWNQR